MISAADLLRAQSRRLVEAGAWADVTAILERSDTAVRDHPDLGTLFGESLLRGGRARDASEWFSVLLERLQQSPDRATFRRATLLAGHAHLEIGAMDAARQAFETGFTAARSDGDEVVAARAMNNLGILANIEGRGEEAMAQYQLALSAYQRLGNSRGLAECYHNMAITHRDLGRLDDADQCEQRSVEFARDIGDERLTALARLGRAELALRRGDHALAEAGARLVAASFARLGDLVREADAVRLAGVACTALGKYGQAAELLARALEATRTHGAVLNEAETLRARAELRVATGDNAGAREDAESALALFQSLQAAREAAEISAWLRSLPEL